VAHRDQYGSISTYLLVAAQRMIDGRDSGKPGECRGGGTMNSLDELTTMTLTIRAWHELHHHLLRSQQRDYAELVYREVIQPNSGIEVPGPRHGTLVVFTANADTIRGLQDQLEDAALNSPFEANG
jgi:hypothetical protein